jgi:hypothetical protein
VQALYACPSPALSSAWGALGVLGEPSYRLYNCARCAVQVRICRRCDHGNVYCGDDSYLQSDLGLDSGLDRRYGVDLNWMVNQKIAAYATLGREKIDSRTRGSSTFTTADWVGRVQDDFETYGAGNSRTRITGAGDGIFPVVKSDLSSFKAGVTYGFSERADLRLTWWYETLKTSDWSYNAQPAAMLTVPGLGVDPYNYDVN